MKRLKQLCGHKDKDETVFVTFRKTLDEKALMIVVVDELGNTLPNGLIGTLSFAGIFRSAGLDPKYGFSIDIEEGRITDLVLEDRK